MLIATDLENLEKPESQGICDRIPKVREKSGNLLSEIHFQLS